MRRRTNRRAPAAGACVALLGLAGAGATVLADAPVLHEYIPDVDPNEAALQVRALRGERAQVVYDGELLDAPDLDSGAAVPTMNARPDDGVGAAAAGSRAPSFRPDRITDLEGELSYHSAFNPVVAPFKRVSSLDRVVIADDGRTPLLTVAGGERTEVPIETPDAPAPDDRPRDRFWGEVELDFDSGGVVPLPSVSPESRILSLRSKPSVMLAVERDGADNYHVVARRPARAVRVRLAFLMDAPRAYFGTEIDRAPVDRFAHHVAPMPQAVRDEALTFAAELGLSPASDLRDAVHALTGHFRAFEESSEPPPDTGHIYLDLARAKRGICRHRTYAFVITAQALGLPARFVMNEAHSFVEVMVDEGRWMRIDLGGAANSLTAHGASQRPRYRPTEPDRLPRPPAYVRSYSQASEGVAGLRSEVSEAQQGRWIEPQPGFGSAPAQPPPGGDAQGAQAVVQDAPAAGDPTLAAGRAPLVLTVDQDRHTALRGESMVVSGRIADGRGRPRGGLRVEISLAAADRDARLLLGVTVTDADGNYRAPVGLPPDLPVGDYHLVVVTPGNEDFLPARGQ